MFFIFLAIGVILLIKIKVTNKGIALFEKVMTAVLSAFIFSAFVVYSIGMPILVALIFSFPIFLTIGGFLSFFIDVYLSKLNFNYSFYKYIIGLLLYSIISFFFLLFFFFFLFFFIVVFSIVMPILVVLLFSFPIFLTIGVFLSFFIDVYLSKLNFNDSFYKYITGLLLYTISSFLIVGLFFYIQFSFVGDINIFLFNVFMISMIPALLFYHISLLFKAILKKEVTLIKDQ